IMKIFNLRKTMIKLPSVTALRTFSAVLALLFAGSLQAQNMIRYQGQPAGSKMKIEGTSTLHDWTVETQAVGGFMELDSAFDADLKTLKTMPKVEVTIRVRQLKSSDNKPSMDKVMYEHMNLKDNPVVKYRLLELKPKAAQG